VVSLQPVAHGGGPRCCATVERVGMRGDEASFFVTAPHFAGTDKAAQSMA